jgi:hypothetical protein
LKLTVLCHSNHNFFLPPNLSFPSNYVSNTCSLLKVCKQKEIQRSYKSLIILPFDDNFHFVVHASKSFSPYMFIQMFVHAKIYFNKVVLKFAFSFPIIYVINHVCFLKIYFCFYCTGHRTERLTHARQAVCHGSTPSVTTRFVNSCMVLLSSDTVYLVNFL